MANKWVLGARPRTLPAAIAPVIVATAFAGKDWQPVQALLALVVSLSLQIGVNYANDYSDGIRGTDDDRIGPVRLVGQGLATPEQVKKAALLSFAVSVVAIDCTLTGAPPPTKTDPTLSWRVSLRGASGLGGTAGIPRFTMLLSCLI